MSGHSKWHNIRLRKGKQDAVRGALFTKLAKEIIVAAKQGGGNPDGNHRLRLAVQKARESSMPADRIKNAIQRGTGEIEGEAYEEIIYEGYAPGGVAVLVECATDNRNRTVADVRSIFSKSGGRLGESGSVSYLFSPPTGLVTVARDAADEDTVISIALEAGAADVKALDDTYEVYCGPGELVRVSESLEAAGIKVANAEVTMIPVNTVRVEGKDAEQVIRLVERMEEHDDVQRVHANFDIPDEVLESATA